MSYKIDNIFNVTHITYFMLFNNYWVRLLGSKAKTLLALHLTKNEIAVSERELATQLNMSPMTVNRIMREFASLGLIKPMKSANSNAWKVDKTSFAFKQLTHLKSPKSALISDLKNSLRQNKNIKSVHLFGSIVKELEKENSDIDIFVVVSKASELAKVNLLCSKLKDELLKTYGNLLSPIIITKKELAIKMQNKDTLVVDVEQTGVRII